MSFFRLNISLFKNIYFDKDISFILLAIGLFLLPLSVNLSSFALISSISLKIIQILFFKQKVFQSKRLKYSSLIGLFFLSYIVINSIFQSGIQHTFLVFEKQFSHYILLVLAPSLLRSKRDNLILSNAFILGLIIACLYVFVLTFLLNFDFDRNAFEKILDIHHTYLSIYILFLVNHLLINYLQKQDLKWCLKSIYVLIIILSFLIIFFVKSKVSIALFAILLGGYLIRSFSKKNVFKHTLVMLFLVLGIVIFKNKLNITYEKAMDFRMEIWQQSLTSIKENLFFGNLRMNENEVLNLKHYLNGKYYLMDSNLNSHNQYLSFLLKYGVIGFSIFLLFLLNMGFKLFNKSIPSNSFNEAVGFGIILLLIFYIENIFDRHHGIVFFSVFFNYYLLAIQNEDN